MPLALRPENASCSGVVPVAILWAELAGTLLPMKSVGMTAAAGMSLAASKQSLFTYAVALSENVTSSELKVLESNVPAQADVLGSIFMITRPVPVGETSIKLASESLVASKC